MSERYGPQTAEIEALLERIRNLTDDEAQEFWVARYAARYAARAAVWAALGAAWYAAMASEDAARYAAWNAVPVTVWAAARDAVVALAVRDLIGQHGFTQEHYDILVGPWESVIGTEWTRE